MPLSANPLPDIAVGRHPDFGIIATNSQGLAASTWMLRRLDFLPVPGHPDLYAMADQQRDGPGRATRAVDLLRRANYRVEVEAEFDTFPGAPSSVPATVPQRIEPEVAFADHPQLGIVAATTGGAVVDRQLLEDHGWRRHPSLDIYVLPPGTGRDQALDRVAQATAAMHRVDLQVVVQPALSGYHRAASHRSDRVGAPGTQPRRRRAQAPVSECCRAGRQPRPHRSARHTTGCHTRCPRLGLPAGGPARGVLPHPLTPHHR